MTKMANGQQTHGQARYASSRAREKWRDENRREIDHQSVLKSSFAMAFIASTLHLSRFYHLCCGFGSLSVLAKGSVGLKVAVISSLCAVAMSTRSPPPAVPPVSPYGTFQGNLFQYSGNLVAFESSPRIEEEVSKKLILIGGLSDGLLPTPYAPALEQACHAQGWSLVQPILSSSYLGFGNGDLDRDTQELSALMWYLTCHRSGEQYALVGHSTGCQNSIHFLKVRMVGEEGDCLCLMAEDTHVYSLMIAWNAGNGGENEGCRSASTRQ